MCGLPASGKSNIALQLSIEHDAEIYSSDAIRKELYNDEDHQADNEIVFGVLHQRIRDRLQRGKSAIFDATNINAKRRIHFLKEIKNFVRKNHPSGTIFKTSIYFIAKPYEQCIHDNQQRERQVPTEVINKMLRSIWIPQRYEGWDEVNIIYPSAPQYDYVKDWHCWLETADYLFNDLMVFKQDNPYHKHTLGRHMLETQKKLRQLGNNHLTSWDGKCLDIAALYHDIGKRHTKKFEDRKGNPTRRAHYYGHPNASAYEFVTMVNRTYITLTNGVYYPHVQNTVLRVADYIQHHMRPYDFVKEGDPYDYMPRDNNFIKLAGQDFWNNLVLLNEADRSSH